jgi:leucyl-tRNA synthetase
MNQYDPKKIEAKWQKIWQETNLYKTPTKPKNPYYGLVMFAYPSGNLHCGHWYPFVGGDILARSARMHGHDVLHTNGFDAFGLPAENAAIKRGLMADVWTDENITAMNKQYAAMGNMYDWSRMINTSKPDYYKWTQWLFLQLFKKGKAYQKEALVNWDPVDKTVLANEQVINGRAERSGAEVEKKNLKQWFFKITDYADDLLSGLDDIDWPERIKDAQRNWIGRSHGSLVKFPINDSNKSIEVYTTRIDTLFSGTFLVLAPEHPMANELTMPDQKAKVDKYIEVAQSKTDTDRLEAKEKTGVFTGSYATNPANNEKMPVWIADFVLGSYGTGAVFADGHDERDVELALKYDIPLKWSIEPVTGVPQANPEYRRSIVALVHNPKTDEVMTINWGKDGGGTIFIGGGVDQDEDLVACALREIAEETGYTDVEFVRQTENIHHHYFAHSKNVQREILATGLLFELKSDKREDQKLEKDEQGKFEVEWLKSDKAEHQVSDELHNYVFRKLIKNEVWTGDGILYNSGQFDGMGSAEAREKITEWLAEKGMAKKTTQSRLRDWLISRQRYWGAPIPIIYCDECGVVPVPEDDLPVVLPLGQKMDKSGRSPLFNDSFINTTCPECSGPAKRETDTMDTFVDSSWYYLRYPNPHYANGPFDPKALKEWLPVNTYIGGPEHATMHLLYVRFIAHFLHQQKQIPMAEPLPHFICNGLILGPDGNKMSKSKGNVVDPDEYVSKYGADSVRLYMMFMGPYTDGGPWDPKRFEGANRFINKLYDLVAMPYAEKELDTIVEAQLQARAHKLVKKVGDDIEAVKFNTAISATMEFVNYAASIKPKGSASAGVWRDAIEMLVLVLAPVTPLITEELWEGLGNTESVHLQAWPKFDEALVKDDVVTIVVQVNGKLKGEFVATAGSSQQELEDMARDLDKEKNITNNGEIVKVIVVPNRLVNFVVKQK